MNNNVDYEKLIADEAKARQEAEAAAAVKAVVDKRKQLDDEEQELERQCKDLRGDWGYRERDLTPEQADLSARRKWLGEYVRGRRNLYPFPAVVPVALGEEIADRWEKASERNDYYDVGKQRDLEDMPEQIREIIKRRQEERAEKWKRERREEEEERQQQKEQERKQRESARWAWENGRRKRLLSDKTNTELLAMIELNLREISYWLEHYAFKSRRY